AGRPQGPAPPDKLGRFASVVLASTEDVWTDIFSRNGKTYEKPRLVLFTQMSESGCGVAQAAVGPFYCEQDHKIYIDLSFFQELSQGALEPVRGLRRLRGCLRARPRGRPPRAEPARPLRQGRRLEAQQRGLGPHRAAGGLLRGSVGKPRQPRATVDRARRLRGRPAGRRRDRRRPAPADGAGNRAARVLHSRLLARPPGVAAAGARERRPLAPQHIRPPSPKTPSPDRPYRRQPPRGRA